MFWKFIRESFWRPGTRHHALWAILAVALGTAIASAMLSVSLDVGDKVGRELRSLGANIVITPAADSLPVEIGGIDYRPVSDGTYIPESSLPKLKEIFWRNNIMAFAPFLYVPVRVARTGTPDSAAHAATVVGTWFNHSFVTERGDRFQTGIQALNPSWKIDGDWIDDSRAGGDNPACIIGKTLAQSLGARPGASVTLLSDTAQPSSCNIEGVLSTGGAEDDQVFTSLAFAQSLSGLEGKARKVQVSALIKPEDERSRRDPKSMTPAEYERWYCSPYVSSILLQIREVMPGAEARQIQPVLETQGKVLSKLTFLMGTLAILALIAAALTVSSIASIRIVKRRQEISLMKAIGGQDRTVRALFLAEAALQGAVGAALGFGAGLLLARALERVVFGSQLLVNWTLLPLILLTGLAVSLLGVWGPLRNTMKYEPAVVLRGE
jgi:putative ABC transport system permease protein